MRWNWQQPDWPHFTWDELALAHPEHQFLLLSGEFVGTAKHLTAEDQDQIVIEAMCEEALTTSEIEGEMLDRASVLSSIRRELGLTTDSRRIAPAERGIAEMMVSLHRSFVDPLSDEVLFNWHRMLLSGRSDVKDIGGYRTHDDPMQIVSSAHVSNDPTVHYEAPPSGRVQHEMSEFIIWFNATAPTGSKPLPALTRAGIAHLYFESIHPFEDGNGRIGRAISEKALAQTVGHLTYTALAAAILGQRRAYYQALEDASAKNEVTEWLRWFAQTTIEAQQRTMSLVEFLIGKTRLLDRLRGHLNARQEKALLRVFHEGPQGFRGGLSAANYMSITGAASATATRDLTDLAAKGALTRMGEHRHARYYLNLDDKK